MLWLIAAGGADAHPPPAAEMRDVIERMKPYDDPECGGNAVMLGVPAWWRDGKEDALPAAQLHPLICAADIISPWTVGRIDSVPMIDTFANEIWRKDLDWLAPLKKLYLPVAFPGFRRDNLAAADSAGARLRVNIPRLRGDFFWQQILAAKQAGANSLYIAMFDEMDEGTAIFKTAPQPPVGASTFIDLEGVPPDHYLRLAHKAAEELNRQASPP